MTEKLIVKWLGGREWELIEDCTYTVPGGETITVPKGFVTDMASVPRAFWWLYNPTGPKGRAAVLHDWLYHNAGLPVPTGKTDDGFPMWVEYSRREADRIFRQVMLDDGIRRSAVATVYRSVRLFGWYPWRKYIRQNQQD